MDEKAENLKRALQKGELFEYLVGEKDYAYVCPYADMPTYPAQVLASIVSYYDATGDSTVWQYFDASLLAVSADQQYAWLSLYYLVEYLRYSKRIRPLNLTQLSHTVVENVRAAKESLLAAKKWVGRDYPDGLWGDAQRMVTNINEEHDLQLKL